MKYILNIFVIDLSLKQDYKFYKSGILNYSMNF